MAASQYCGYSDYAALIIRKSYPDLSLPGAIMDRAVEWWSDKHGIKWHGTDHRMTWPSGAVIQFGHLGKHDDHLRYQGAQLHFVGFDEATQIPANQLTYLHSRLRRKSGSNIPIRYRLATNPGGVSHDFVRENYVQGADGRTKVYLPALLHENPGLDQELYRKQLEQLDPITRRQLEDGDWDVHLSGGFFEVEKIGTCSRMQVPSGARRFRVWDLAATPESPGADPDWTVGILLAVVNDEYWILDMVRLRAGPGQVEERVLGTAAQDGRSVTVLIEQEPGSSGAILSRHWARKLAGYVYKPVKSSSNKADKARPLASAVSNHLVKWAVEAEGKGDMQSEFRAFSADPTKYAHDDIVDAMSMAHNEASQPEWSVVIPPTPDPRPVTD